MATIQDIANRANVSKATVSRVINKTTRVNRETRDAVVAAIKDLNFEPNMMARSLAGGRSMTIGVVTQNIGSPFYDTIAQGVIKGLSETNYSPIFADGQWENSTSSGVIATLLGRNVDGIVLIGGAVPAKELTELTQTVPVVVVARDVKGWNGPCIHADNEEAACKATRHLIQMGHQAIALIQGISDHPDAIDRLNGYRRALGEAGIPVDSNLILPGDFTAQSGVFGVNSLMTRGIRFSAVVAANDMAAFGARLASHRHGLRVPEDISIVGFDDQAESAFATPPLTTMRQPASKMGQSAARTIVNTIEGKAVEVEDFEIELVSRESVSRLV